jgi:hypothetical protein
MKKLIIPALLAAATSYGALTPATGSRLTDYTNWFKADFSDTTTNGTTLWSPKNNQTKAHVGAYVTPFATWAGFKGDFTGPGGVSLVGPITNTSATLKMSVEVVYLGESGGWKNNLGMRLNGVDSILAANIDQNLAWAPTVNFGDYTTFKLNPGNTLDFFVSTPVSPSGGKYYVFDKTLNVPIANSKNSYWGTLNPLVGHKIGDPANLQAFTVISVEDKNDKQPQDDWTDVVYAFRAVYDLPDASVPEASTYGLIGAAALIGIVGYRRFKKQA